MLAPILKAFGLNAGDCTVTPFGSGLINSTWKIDGPNESYILQRINAGIFKSPQAIAQNLELLKGYLAEIAPDYLFAAPLATSGGELMVIHDGGHYRLQPFIKNSHTVDTVSSPVEAYEAAKQFGRFSKLLNGFDTTKLQYTLPDFHNLELRENQFEAALKTADVYRITSAAKEITKIKTHADIALTYKKIKADGTIPLRVIHHDTKINNVLFDDEDKGLCVIDLDTVMPGYFISDVGDMMRTYLSPANEEEGELEKVYIRTENLEAIHRGYMEEMGGILTQAETDLFYYSGKFMIYMQALRFLTDYLNRDVYYHTTYPGQNLVRAQNQLRLLGLYVEAVR